MKKYRIDEIRKDRRHSHTNPNVVNVDPDIKRDEIKSPTIRSLLDVYSSFILADNEQDIVHFFPNENCFLSFHDSYTAFPAAYDDKQRFDDLDQTLLFVPIIKAFYCVDIYRRRGYQASTLHKIMEIAEMHRECLLAFSSPYVLKKEYKAKTGWTAFKTFQKDGHDKGPDFDDQLAKQKVRLRKAGFINVEYEWHELTAHGDSWVYMPSGVSDDTRKIVESRIIAT